MTKEYYYICEVDNKKFDVGKGHKMKEHAYKLKEGFIKKKLKNFKTKTIKKIEIEKNVYEHREVIQHFENAPDTKENRRIILPVQNVQFTLYKKSKDGIVQDIKTKYFKRY